MSELGDAQRKLEEANQAASAGDLASADRLLRDAARIQEAELGPVHPDLANTLNNLAVVAERTERLADAESFYRRATAIASASLPADHPMVVDSRQNLVEFCRARGLPVDPPTVTAPARRNAEPEPDAVPPKADLRSTRGTERSTPVPRHPTRRFQWVATALVILAVASFVMTRRSPSRDASTTSPEVTSPAEPPPSPATPVAIEDPPPPAIDSPGADPDGVPEVPRAPVSSSEAVSLVTAELCETLSTTGIEWQCDPIGDTVARGPIVFYTRVRTPRATEIVHLWYHGDAPPQSRTMTVGANPGEGYRTYSRKEVDVVGDWRVELRTAGGDLLTERRFSVR